MSCAPTRTSNRPSGRSGSLKGPDLQIRPIHHRLEDRVRAHVLICMLAYYLTWHLKAAWKPLLFTDEHRPVSPDPVAKAVRSPAAQQKAQTKRTSDRAARAQLPHAPRRARDPDPEHHPPARPHQHLREAHPADRAASRSARSRRTRPRRGRSVDTTRTPQTPENPGNQPDSATSPGGTSGTRAYSSASKPLNSKRWEPVADSSRSPKPAPTVSVPAGPLLRLALSRRR